MRIFSIIFLLALSLQVHAADYRYFVGGGPAIISYSGGNLFNFDNEQAIGFSLGQRFSDNWALELAYSTYSFSNDTSATLKDSIAGFVNTIPLNFQATRIGAMINRRITSSGNKLRLTGGIGGGLLIWKDVNPVTNTSYSIINDKNQMIDFSATELFLSSSLGIEFQLLSRFSIRFEGRADYLTSAGVELQSDMNSARDKISLGGLIKLNFGFGKMNQDRVWRSDSAWMSSRRLPRSNGISQLDSDGDGIQDSQDSCFNTPPGAIVNKNGCPIDTDYDGVPDGLDNCPGTLTAARSSVDIHGCPIDSDFDGLADYEDNCPNGPVGGKVDDVGCSIDSDNDGVPDGLDDCPFSLPSVKVDKNGCIDVAIFNKPMVINIDYAPGSFEVDPHNRERIKKLSGLLNFVKDYKLEIIGYTDNIGTASANRKLSEKRANRVKDYLVLQGVTKGRIKVFGRGETNFVASNQTAVGRAKNRRIEILFYK